MTLLCKVNNNPLLVYALYGILWISVIVVLTLVRPNKLGALTILRNLNCRFKTTASRFFLMDMDSMLEPMVNKLTRMVNSTATVDENVNNWFLMEKPWPMLTIVAAYLYFVIKLGPKLMDNRKPMDLKNTLLVYNCCQVVFSSWWIYKVLSDSHITQHFFRSACNPSSKEIDPQITIAFDSMAWFYLMSKFVELLDTIFFVLRKKQNQISFLHLYHHTIMAIGTWAFLKYIRGSQTILIGVVNSAVHVVMYSYYLLSAMGPRVQKYLWWKRYLTSMQLFQFVFVIGYLGCLLYLDCEVPRQFIMFSVANTFAFLVLFSNFYYKTYSKKTT